MRPFTGLLRNNVGNQQKILLYAAKWYISPKFSVVGLYKLS